MCKTSRFPACHVTSDPRGVAHSSVMLRGSPLGSACRCLLLQRTTESTQVHWLGHCCPAEQLLSPMAEPADTNTSSQLSGNLRTGVVATLPSLQRKSGMATSCRGISRRKAGLWQRGFPVTMRRLRSHEPNQERRQSQLKGLDSRFLAEGRREEGEGEIV